MCLIYIAECSNYIDSEENKCCIDFERTIKQWPFVNRKLLKYSGHIIRNNENSLEKCN